MTYTTSLKLGEFLSKHIRHQNPLVMIVEDKQRPSYEIAGFLQDLNYRVCGIAEDKATIMELFERYHPDIILIHTTFNEATYTALKDTFQHLVDKQDVVTIACLTNDTPDQDLTIAKQLAKHLCILKSDSPELALDNTIQNSIYQHTIEKYLRETERWLLCTLHSIQDAIITTDLDGVVTFINQHAQQLLKIDFERAIGTTIETLIPLPDMHSPHPIKLLLESHGDARILFACKTQTIAAETLMIDIAFALAQQTGHHTLGAIISFRNAQTRVAQESHIIDNHTSLESLMNTSGIAVACIALNGNILSANTAYANLFGVSELPKNFNHAYVSHEHDKTNEEALLIQLLSGKAPIIQFEKRYFNMQGNVIKVFVNAFLIKQEDQPLCYVYQVFPYSSAYNYQQNLLHLAHFDSLTGLANRARLFEETNRQIAYSKRNQLSFGIVICDLDNFKQINDSFGHEAGDRILQIAALRLKECVRESDCVARLGGDEFAILLTHLENSNHIVVVLNKIIKHLGLPIELFDTEIHLEASFGISQFLIDGEDVQTLLRNADSALYEAKAKNKSGFQFYRPELTEVVEYRMRLDAELRKAIERQEFELYFQPVIDLTTNKAISAEALIRWNHPTRGFVSPDQFIPYAEESNLIISLGEWIIHEACKQAKCWNQTLAEPVGVAVNISARQFKNGKLSMIVRHALKRSGLKPHLLCLEITEQLLLENTEDNLRQISELKSHGVKIAVDDFGVGYSSLSYIIRFSPHYLKIDRSFISKLGQEKQYDSMVGSIIALGKNLPMRVIAEGVETEDQWLFLRDHGCDEAQGYLFSKPLSANNLALDKVYQLTKKS